MTDIIFKLINREANAKLLENVPYKEFLDLAIVFYRVLPKDEKEEGITCCIIDNKSLEKLDTSVDELMAYAVENTPKILGLKVQGILSAIEEYSGDEETVDLAGLEEADIPLYVATNTNANHGASVLLYRDFLKALSAKLKADLYVIPCSVHEVIVFKAITGCQMDTGYLKSLISEVNRKEVPKGDVLSDSLYYFSRVDNELSIA
ncbi:MAG: DUF5688 family protein [Pseudobutyrivibrio sp.]|nr:DUF5688 family protein [Pseudobutyrivibrio sp.]